MFENGNYRRRKRRPRQPHGASRDIQEIEAKTEGMAGQKSEQHKHQGYHNNTQPDNSNLSVTQLIPNPAHRENKDDLRDLDSTTKLSCDISSSLNPHHFENGKSQTPSPLVACRSTENLIQMKSPICNYTDTNNKFMTNITCKEGTTETPCDQWAMLHHLPCLLPSHVNKTPNTSDISTIIDNDVPGQLKTLSEIAAHKALNSYMHSDVHDYHTTRNTSEVPQGNLFTTKFSHSNSQNVKDKSDQIPRSRGQSFLIENLISKN